MCHRTKFCQNRPSGFRDITIFRFSRWLPSAILDVRIFKFLVSRQVERARMHHYTKFHQNRSKGCRDIACNVLQNGSRPPCWICGQILGQPTTRI